MYRSAQQPPAIDIAACTSRCRCLLVVCHSWLLLQSVSGASRRPHTAVGLACGVLFVRSPARLPLAPAPCRLQGHENITYLQGAYEDKQAVHLVMDLCSGGELFDRWAAADGRGAVCC